MKRLVIYMRQGEDHVLDFETDDEAAAALAEVSAALAPTVGGPRAMMKPKTIAGRLVVLPADVRSAELTDPPTFGIA